MPREHVLVRHHARVAEIREHVVAQPRAGRNRARQDAQARLREHLVTADVVGVHARVDDVANRQRREAGESRPAPRRPSAGAGVDEDDAFGPRLHEDVAARAADDVEVLAAAARPRSRSPASAAQTVRGVRCADARSVHAPATSSRAIESSEHAGARGLCPTSRFIWSPAAILFTARRRSQASMQTPDRCDA